ncbi:hypothetical protein CPB97_000545 [Podila verticillata]|nr:hypothetical protein CPB97_000545 [Podila verticillata]
MRQLPDDCIHNIVHHLRHDIYSLFRMLTVSRSMFHATLPVLYADPYRTLERQIRREHTKMKTHPPTFSQTLTAKKLLYLLLLSCRQADDLVPFLSIDWPDALSPVAQETQLQAPYIDYLKDLDFNRWINTLKCLIIEFDTQMEEYAIRVFRLMFLDHHKERVQVLNIPVTHLEPYQEMVASLKSLQRIQFYEDKLEEEQPVETGERNNEEETTDEENARKEQAARVKRIEYAVPRAVTFLQAHRKLFSPSVSSSSSSSTKGPVGLQEITPPRYWIHADWSGNPTHDAHFVELLQALKTPAMVNFAQWERFSTQLEKVPLDKVTHLRGFCSDWSEARWDQSKVLEQCRSLERFSSVLTGPNIFSWALEEQKDRDIYEALRRSGVAGEAFSLGQGNSHGGYYGPGKAPMPLRKVEMMSGDEQFSVPVLKDICAVFSKTLESVKVRHYSMDDPFPLRMFSHQPRLHTIDITHRRGHQFFNDASFLRECPQLEVLRLSDYNPTELDLCSSMFDLQEPWRLPRLKELVLVGTMAHNFNYATLNHTPALRSLRLECVAHGTRETDVHVTHAAYSKLASNYSWTWNWDLPSLESIHLNGRPAHIFRFSQISRCPRLQSVSLNLGTVPRLVSAEEDLFPSKEPFSSVRSLVLKGPWKWADDILFSRFLLTWFGGATFLHLKRSFPEDLKTLLDSFRLLKNLRKVKVHGLHVCDYDAWKLGLEDAIYKSSREWEEKYRDEFFCKSALERIEKEKQRIREEEAQERAEEQALQEVEDALEIMSTAFAVLETQEEGEEEVATVDEVSKEPIPETVDAPSERTRSETVDSACALDDKQILSEQEQKRELEQAMAECHRCVYVFNGHRYHFKDIVV